MREGFVAGLVPSRGVMAKNQVELKLLRLLMSSLGKSLDVCSLEQEGEEEYFADALRQDNLAAYKTVVSALCAFLDDDTVIAKNVVMSKGIEIVMDCPHISLPHLFMAAEPRLLEALLMQPVGVYGPSFYDVVNYCFRNSVCSNGSTLVYLRCSERNQFILDFNAMGSDEEFLDFTCFFHRETNDYSSMCLFCDGLSSVRARHRPMDIIMYALLANNSNLDILLGNWRFAEALRRDKHAARDIIAAAVDIAEMVCTASSFGVSSHSIDVELYGSKLKRLIRFDRPGFAKEADLYLQHTTPVMHWDHFRVFTTDEHLNPWKFQQQMYIDAAQVGRVDVLSDVLLHPKCPNPFRDSLLMELFARFDMWDCPQTKMFVASFFVCECHGKLRSKYTFSNGRCFKAAHGEMVPIFMDMLEVKRIVSTIVILLGKRYSLGAPLYAHILSYVGSVSQMPYIDTVDDLILSRCAQNLLPEHRFAEYVFYIQELLSISYVADRSSVHEYADQ